MRSVLRTTALLAAIGLMLACTTSSNEAAAPMDPACEKACDEVYQACDLACMANVESNMCEPECLAALRGCTDRCS